MKDVEAICSPVRFKSCNSIFIFITITDSGLSVNLKKDLDTEPKTGILHAMITGRYASVAWDELTCFALRQIHSNSEKFFNHYYNTCGTSAISTLTGLHPRFVERYRPKKNPYWSSTAMIGFLKTRGFRVQPVTKCGVTALSKRNNEFERMPIGPLHVLLCNSLCCRDEASWFIVHYGVMYHNFESFEMNPFFFVNKPTQYLWVVKHPKWNLTNLPKAV